MLGSDPLPISALRTVYSDADTVGLTVLYRLLLLNVPGANTCYILQKCRGEWDSASECAVRFKIMHGNVFYWEWLAE